MQTPCQSKRIPMMASAPIDLILGRDDRIREAKHLLLKGSPAIALLGPGGVGRRFAQTVCGDPDVMDAFDGGVLWASLGAQPNLATALGTILAALAGDPSPGGTLEEIARKLAEALSGRRYLVVCDGPAPMPSTSAFSRGRNCHASFSPRDIAASRRNSTRTCLRSVLSPMMPPARSC